MKAVFDEAVMHMLKTKSIEYDRMIAEQDLNKEDKPKKGGFLSGLFGGGKKK